MSEVKWDEIKVEYITNSDMSLRKLAKKYGVSVSSIAKRSSDEKWKEQKEQFLNESVTKTLDKIMDQQAQRRARVYRIADRLLDKLEKAVEELDFIAEAVKVKESEVTTGGIEIETTKERVDYKPGGVVDRAGAKQITAALKDIKDVQMLRSELDIREQAARVAMLEAKGAEDTDDKGIEIAFEDQMAEDISQ
ncbi:MAG: hypothetical protein J6K89_07130 [Oscillospiraceae bacterium]|nr:hypothetical protein [Oscillospiraceae bacterium]